MSTKPSKCRANEQAAMIPRPRVTENRSRFCPLYDPWGIGIATFEAAWQDTVEQSVLCGLSGDLRLRSLGYTLAYPGLKTG